MAYGSVGDYAESLNAALEAHRGAGQDCAAVYYAKGNAHAGLGQWDEAARNYDVALSMEPDGYWTRRRSGVICSPEGGLNEASGFMYGQGVACETASNKWWAHVEPLSVPMR